ncbi:MAG: hypothetical protein HOC70_07555 [Gammaproteobacteria bacterium]|jgi:pyrrolidone-carboxylate peptidase|nr:hypothetical protein [Gammaproteobacteria bacterium]MBT4493085.1 hypothetical protein [Gammaproteobacteria bacterium]MBT7369219.1 hypothetical protein [Gammaproteobacteria bacterium]
MNAEIERLPEAIACLGEFPVPVPESTDEALQIGHDLWRQSCEHVQSGSPDDRTLYWQRLVASHSVSSPDVLAAFEATSRNHKVRFETNADMNVLVTGFDPFHLDANIDQSNPSGIIALSLDGSVRQLGSRRAEIRAMIMPVRFQDFDEGLIERAIGPLLVDIDLLITVSMGREAFDLERFPGRRRSSEKPDNRRQYCGGTPIAPVVPPGIDGPEFVEFSLPVEVMQAVSGDYGIRDNRRVVTREKGEIKAARLDDLQDQTAVQGSGGGYLSNEISYRAIRLMQQTNRQIPVGHIHTPGLKGYDLETLTRIRDQAVDMIDAAVASLEPPQN